jgi:replicative DNA helicase
MTDTLRVPPHNIHAEQSLLGGLMLDNQTWDNVADRVAEADFYRREHRLIFAAMMRLADAGQPLDLVTIAESLESRSELSEVSGLPYI